MLRSGTSNIFSEVPMTLFIRLGHNDILSCQTFGMPKNAFLCVEDVDALA